LFWFVTVLFDLCGPDSHHSGVNDERTTMRTFHSVLLSALLLVGFSHAAGDSSYSTGSDPQGQSLFLMPTAFTPPRGATSIRVISFALPSLSFSPLASTSVTGGVLLPFPNKFFFAGFKQRLLDFNEGRTAIAATGTVIKPSGSDIGGNDIVWGGSGVVSARLPIAESHDGLGLHGMLGYYHATVTETNEDVTPALKEEKEYNYLTWGIGGELRTGKRFKLIGEYVYGDPRNPRENGGGAFTPGLRYHKTNYSFDAALLITSVEEDDSRTTFLVPLITFGYRF
jgi:hypothetical protein